MTSYSKPAIGVLRYDTKIHWDTGNEFRMLYLQNRSGQSVETGDVVIWDTTNPNAFKLTTTAEDVNVCGVVAQALDADGNAATQTIDNLSWGWIQIAQRCPKVKLTTTASVGHFIQTSTTTGKGKSSADAKPGSFAIALTSGTEVECLLGFISPSAVGLNINAGLLYTDTTSNRVGIGTTSPSEKLDVAGGAFISGSVGAWGSFTVGGTSDTFYPVQFRSDPPYGYSGSNDLMIYRPNVHENGMWQGTFFFKLSFHPTNWGHFGAQIEKIEYRTGGGSPYNDPVGDVTDGSTQSGGRDVIIWLKGGATYKWRTLNGGGWTLLNGNPEGTSIVDSSGITHDPITSQSTLIENAKNRFYTNSLSLGTAGSGYFGGNVGIGTTGPNALLHVYRTSTETVPMGYFEEASPSPGETSLVRIRRPNNLATPSAMEASLYIVDHSANFPLHIEDHAGSALFTIKGNGNVGIATTSPEQKLDVAGTAQLRRVADADAANTLRDSHVLQFQGAYWDGSASVNREMRLYFEITDGSSYALEITDHEGNERFRLARSFGTTLLDLNGVVGGSSWLRFREAGTTAYVIAYDTVNEWWKLRAEQGAGWPAPTDIIRIPDGQLTVDGNSTFDDNAFDFHCQECDWSSAFEAERCPECGGKVEWLDDVALVAASTVANKVCELPKETLRKLEQLGIINTYGTLDRPGRPEVFLRLTQSYWFALSAIKQLYERIRQLESELKALKAAS